LVIIVLFQYQFSFNSKLEHYYPLLEDLITPQQRLHLDIIDTRK